MKEGFIMGNNSTLFQPTTKTGKFLWHLWDAVDISENLHRAERWVRRTPNGLNSTLNMIGMIVLFCVATWFAWFWDIKSTLNQLSEVTDMMVPSLPSQIAHISWILIFFLTIAPTLMEIFTAGLAKENIKVVQLLIIGFTLFDLVTDIPLAYGFIASKWPTFALMPWGISHFVFWVVFALWLALCTLGFELAVVVFGYAALSFALKAVTGNTGASSMNRVIQQVQQVQKQKQQHNAEEGRNVTIIPN